MVDAAVVAVFKAAPGIVGPRVRDLISDAGLSSGAIVIDLAEFVAAGRLDRALLDIRYRYGEVDGLDGILDDWLSRGLIANAGPVDELRSLCTRILALRHEVAASLWTTNTARLVANVTLEAVRAGGGPLVAYGIELPEPTTVAGRCHHALSLMRWARHGAHAAAWLVRGLTTESLAALRASDDPGSVASLQEVERDTNLWCVPMMVTIGSRFEEWMEGLQELAP